MRLPFGDGVNLAGLYFFAHGIGWSNNDENIEIQVFVESLNASNSTLKSMPRRFSHYMRRILVILFLLLYFLKASMRVVLNSLLVRLIKDL